MLAKLVLSTVVATTLNLVSLSFASSSHQQLIFQTETSDKSEGTSEVYLELDENYDITQVVRKDWEIDPKTQRPYEEVEYYTLEQLKKGLVLESSQGLAIVSLKAPDLEAHLGGSVDLTYLKSGLSKNYATETFSVSRLGDDWHAYAPNGEGFSTMYFVLRELFGKKIGIKQVIYRN